MKIAVIGGAGKMGRWFAEFLSKDGKEIVISGRNREKLLEVKRQLGVEVAGMVEAVQGADYIIISVPIESLEEVASGIAPHLRLFQLVQNGNQWHSVLPPVSVS